MKSYLVFGSVFGTVLALFGTPDVTVTAKNMETVEDYDGTPKLTWENSGTAITIQRAPADADEWTDLATVEAGVAEYVDATAKVSRSYRYRLADAEGVTGASSSAFTVLRYLKAKGYPVVFVGDFTSQSWCKPARNSFDESIGDDSYPDSVTTHPQVGVDFGSATNYVKMVRLFPRVTNGCQGRLNGTTVYGLNGTWSTEADNAGQALTDALSGAGESVWYSLDVDASTAYRYYYIQGSHGGNVAECQFWGWTQEDLDAERHVDVAFTVERTDYIYSHAVIRCDASYDGMSVQRQKGDASEDWVTLGTVAGGTFTDTTIPYGGVYNYRLMSDAGESSVLPFIRMHRISTEKATFFTDGPLDQGWCQPPAKAFDGDSGSYPDINLNRPKVGVDFGVPNVVVARVRMYPRGNTLYRCNDVSLYGSQLSASLEIESGLADKLTDGTPVFDAPAWVELDVAEPAAYRSYYMYKPSGDFYGNITECELYGWTLEEEGGEVGLDFAVQPQNYETFYPALTWNNISEGAVAVQRSESAEGGWTTLARIEKDAEQMFVDTTARYGRPYYYRLSYDGTTSDTVCFRRLRRIPVTLGTVFGNNQGAWNDSKPEDAFDDNVKTFPDLTREDNAQPKVGVDFASEDIAVALVRIYPRNDWGGGVHLSSGAIFYGSNRTAAEESELVQPEGATQLTQGTSFEDDKPMWQVREVAAPDFFRTYFYRGCYAGNLAEVEFYGWYRSDVQHPFTLFIR